MRYEMKFVRGHVEIYDGEGNFVFSADNEREAEEDLQLLSTPHPTRGVVHPPCWGVVGCFSAVVFPPMPPPDIPLRLIP